MELNVREQKMRLYIVPGVKKDTPFETQTRKEISVSTGTALILKRVLGRPLMYCCPAPFALTLDRVENRLVQAL